MNDDVIKVGLAILGVWLLLLSVFVGVIALDTEQGEQGPEGQKGLDGTDGIDGIDGLDGIDGIDGENGTDGEQGQQGPPGENCTENEVANITDVDLYGTYNYHESAEYHHEWDFWITVDVDDPEDDNMHIDIYWRENQNDSWTLEAGYIGGDGEYSAHCEFLYETYSQDNKTIYWLVETWDGSDIGLNQYQYIQDIV